MSLPKDGGPAYPVPGLNNNAYFNGMSLRDAFALSAICPLKKVLAKSRIEEISRMTREAYAIADAMLIAREIQT